MKGDRLTSTNEWNLEMPVRISELARRLGVTHCELVRACQAGRLKMDLVEMTPQGVRIIVGLGDAQATITVRPCEVCH